MVLWRFGTRPAKDCQAYQPFGGALTRSSQIAQPYVFCPYFDNLSGVDYMDESEICGQRIPFGNAFTGLSGMFPNETEQLEPERGP